MKYTAASIETAYTHRVYIHLNFSSTMCVIYGIEMGLWGSRLAYIVSPKDVRTFIQNVFTTQE